MEALRETLIIAEHDLVHSVRSTKALVFLFIYALLSVMSGAGVVWTVAKLNDKVNEQIGPLAAQMPEAQFEEKKAEAYLEFVKLFVEDDSQAEYLTSIPLIILFFFWATRLFLPWLIALMSFDQINGTIHNRSIRYTLLRARRGTVLAGKLIANMVLVIGLTVITNLVLVLLAIFMIDDFDTGAAFWHLLRFWGLVMPLGLCFVAMMAWLSATFRYPYSSLIVGLALLLLTGVVNLVAPVWEEVEFLKWGVPWHYSGYLMSHLPGEQLFGVGGLLGFAAIFILLAYVTLRWRDV